MNIDEFNEKYKEYLEEGHYGLAIDVPEVIDYLDKLFQNLLTKIDGFEYSQIKLKFGEVRFYTNLHQIKDNRDIGIKLSNIIQDKIESILRNNKDEN